MRGNRLRLATLIVAVLVLAAAGARAILLHYPSADECTASGRTVDATFRHCESADGFVEIREHVVFHIRDAMFAVVVLGLGAWAVAHSLRRFRASASDS